MSNHAMFQKIKIPKLGDPDWSRLSAFICKVADEGRGVMPHEIGNEAEVDYGLARTLLIALGADGLAENYILLYHHCSPAPVDCIPLSVGLPEFPWICPECSEDVDSEDDLGFDLMCKIKQPIDFV